MRAFLFIGCCLLLFSCFDRGDCLYTNTNLVKVNFMKLSARTKADTVSVESVLIPKQGYIIPINTDVTGVYLPVDPTETEMEYIINYEGHARTLVLGYTNQTIVLSPDCGSYMYQDNLEVKYSTFGDDRVIIKNQRLITSATVNVEIFF